MSVYTRIRKATWHSRCATLPPRRLGGSVLPDYYADTLKSTSPVYTRKGSGLSTPLADLSLNRTLMTNPMAGMSNMSLEHLPRMKVALLIATMLATTVLVDSDAVGFRINPRNDKNTGPRSDLRCGSKYGNAICDPYGKYPCCSDWYHCGNTAAHCDCSGCRGEDEKKEVLQDAAAVLKEVVQEAEKEAAMDLLERIASLDGSVAVPQDPAADRMVEWVECLHSIASQRPSLREIRHEEDAYKQDL
ncbi:hypothetical protein Bbelb_310880 [Branchiostoma belcheri]|nr:hypothetical protein Bbelb_310880 [Branchiostoma belcheri]